MALLTTSQVVRELSRAYIPQKDIILQKGCRKLTTAFLFLPLNTNTLMKTYQVNQEGFYGDFGGAYIPEILHRCVEELRNAYLKVLADESFQKEYQALLKDYVGRPSPLYLAKRLSENTDARST